MWSKKFLYPVFVLLIFLSCKKEYSYEGGLYRKCIGCEYLPLCDSSVFVYVDSANTVDTLPGVVRVGNDTTINGIKYNHVTGFAAFPTGLLYNCDGGDYKTILDLVSLGINGDSLVQVLLGTIQLPFPLPPGTSPCRSAARSDRIMPCRLPAICFSGTRCSLAIRRPDRCFGRKRIWERLQKDSTGLPSARRFRDQLNQNG